MTHRLCLHLVLLWFAPLTLVGVSQSFLTNGLTAYYPLQGSGEDQSGNGFHLDCQDVTFASAIGPTMAGFFRETAASLCVVNRSFLARQAYWTWSARVYVPPSDEGSVQALYHEGTKGGPLFRLNVYPAANVLRVTAWNPATPSMWTDVKVPAPMQGKWSGITMTFAADSNYTGLLNVYLNGTLVTTADLSVAAPGPEVPCVAVLGNGWDFGDRDYGTLPFKGGINNVRLYNRALSASEVQELEAYHFVTESDSLRSGLVAHYPFNGNARDESWNHNDGVVSQAVPTVDRFGASDCAYSFDGKTSYIKCSSIPALKIRTNLTIALWIRRASVSAVVLIKGNNRENAYSISLDSDGSVSFNHQDFRVVNHTSLAPPGTWFHVVWTVCPESSRLYLNGALVDETAGGEFFTGDGDLYIGAIDDPPVGWFFAGALDELRIYNRVLSPAEAMQLYTIESGPRMKLIKAVRPAFYNVTIGSKYQLQVSADMSTWIDHGLPFTATSMSVVYPEYWDVDSWNSLFVRLAEVP